MSSATRNAPPAPDEAPGSAWRTASDVPTDTSDERLARALIAGEPWAGAALWDRYSVLVFRLLVRSLGSSDDARDVTQEVFLQILRSVHRLRDPSLLRSWVVSVAMRTLKWQLRTRRLWRWIGLTEDNEPRTDLLDTDEQHAARHFLRILGRMGTREQTVFVLRYVEGFGLTEIAAATHVSLATVKRDIARVAQHVSSMVADDPDLMDLARRGGLA